MNQLPLFSVAADCAVSPPVAQWPDSDSEQLLTMFQDSRLAQGAHARSVEREVSQIRAVMREAGSEGQPAALRALVADLKLTAQVLREPRHMIARSTGRARLIAVQRLIQIMGRALGRDPIKDLKTLDSELPGRRSTGWHATGALVAGTPERRRRRGPTLDAADLHRLVNAAGNGPSALAARDRVLVALHCFSGLRPEEIVHLRWEHLSTELTASGHYGLTATVERNGRQVRLLLPAPALDALTALSANADNSDSLSGPIFRAFGMAN